MKSKKGLGILLAGGLFVAGLTSKLNAKQEYYEYFEDFSNPTSLNEWVISDKRKVYQTDFEEDKILRFDFSENSMGWAVNNAYFPISNLRNKPFKLEWDVYLEQLENNQKTEFNFGVFNEGDSWKKGQAIFVEYNYKKWIGGNQESWRCNTHFRYLQSSGGRGWSGNISEDFFEKWYHNVLLYNYNFEGKVTSGLIIYEGKGNQNLSEARFFIDLSNNPFESLNKVGIIHNRLGYGMTIGSSSKGYIDNISLKIPINLKGDLNMDGIVDFNDYLIFAKDWLKKEDWYVPLK
jgi:hypothetical protein